MESLQRLSEQALDKLRETVAGQLSSPRFQHTISVEEEVARMGEYLLPQKILELRAAALLHDLTKELPLADHLEICRRFSVPCSEEAKRSSAVLHGFTAAEIISESYSDFATEDILSSVRKHTVGASDMSTFDKILFLADYIEPTRPYAACISLRKTFWSSLENAAPLERMLVLDDAIFTQIKQTLTHLLEKGSVIAPESLCLYNAYCKRIGFKG